MSITLGVSVYPEQESLQQIDEYLKLASSHGFTKVFTSMFSVPGTKEEVADYFRKLTGIAHQYGMKVSGDCNTFFLEKMGNGTRGRLDFTWDFRRSGFRLSCEIFSCKEGGSFFKIVRSTY